MTRDEATDRLRAAHPAAWRTAVPVMEALRRAGFEAWLVGGVVRDVLIGRQPGDVDLASNARPEQVEPLAERVIPTGLKHGTVTVLSDGDPVEVTTYRTESTYSDGRRPDDVTFVRTIEEDLGRRDLTVNALAFDPATGTLLDPFDGLADIAAGRLRAVGDPVTRFNEDGLRPFRAIRLAVVLGFEIDPATFDAISVTVPRARQVAAERIRDEFDRMLGARRPSEAIELMRRTGLLALVIPELLEGYGVTQNRYHAFDVYTHILATLDAAPADKPLVRLAALLHDIGKPRTKVVVDGDGTFYNHQHVGADMAREILTRLRYPKQTVDDVAHLVDQHMFHYQPEWTQAAVRRFIQRVGVDHVADLFDLRLADSMGNGLRPAFSHHLEEFRVRLNEELEHQNALTVRDLELTGAEVMELAGIPPGPRVGEILELLLERVIEDPDLNRKESLIELLKAEL